MINVTQYGNNTSFQTKTRLFIRSDGNHSIGMGHLMRCISLAKMLAPLYHTIFLCRSAPPDFNSLCKKNGIEFRYIEEEEDWVLSLLPEDTVVIDHYGISKAIHTMVRARNVFLACIDDLCEREYNADLILNHAIGVLPSNYRNREGTCFALGPDYALLQPEFLEAARKKKTPPSNNAIAVCFGGADPLNLTEIACRVLSDDNQNAIGDVHVICGPGYQFLPQLQELVKPNGRMYLHLNIDAAAMAFIFEKCSFALVTASSIAYEVLSCGCTIFFGYSAKNQYYLYNGLLKMGIGVDLGDLRTGLDAKLKTLVQSSLPHLPQRSALNPFDGKSDLRIKKLFVHCPNRWHLRRALASDVKLLFEWTNDPQARNNATNPTPIVWESHVAWMQDILTSELKKLYVLEWNNQPVGQIRFDISEDRSVVISYSIATSWRGLGIGRVMVRMGMDTLPKGSHCIAIVKPSNIASVRIFEQLGFENQGTLNINGILFFQFHSMS